MSTQTIGLSFAEINYLYDLERKIKRILAAYEAMTPRQKPSLAQFAWPEGDRVPDYYGNDLMTYIRSVWAPDTKILVYQGSASQVDKMLTEIAKWTPLQRKLWWARLGGARWADIHRMLGKKYTRKVVVQVYDELLLKVARTLQ